MQENAVFASGFQVPRNIDVLVHSEAYVTAIAQIELIRFKQQDPTNIFKTADPPNFQLKLVNGQLEKPLAAVLFIFDIGDYPFPRSFRRNEYFDRANHRFVLHEKQQCNH